jgi:hypothetical protein
MVQVLAHTAKEAYRFKTTESVDASSLDEVSQLGEEFAQFVQQKAFECSMGMSQGLNSTTKKVDEQKKHAAFRKSIFEDIQMIPALANTHICYEFDAQFKEMDAKWSKPGKKFSDEPRIGKPTHSGHNGPRRALEYPKFAERDVKVFGTQRQERPFSTSKRYTMPHDRCTIPYKPTPDEATSHLGPGTYAFPDPWKARSGDGNVAGTVAFISESKSRGEYLSDEYNLYREEPTMIPSKVTSRIAHQSLTGSPTRAKSPQDFSRSVIHTEIANRALPTGQMQNRRPQTTSGVMRGSNYSAAPGGLSTYSGTVAAESVAVAPVGGEGMDNFSAAGRTAGTGFRSAATGTSKSTEASKNTPAGTRAQLEHLQVMSTSLHSDPAFYRYLTEARINFVKPGTAPIKFKPAGMTRGALARMPGVSFGNGKLGKSAVDIDTGTTGADKKFRRLKLPSGEAHIYETNKDSNASNMPEGARFTSDWDQTGAYAEKDPALQVQADPIYMEEHPATIARSAARGDQTLPGPSGLIGTPKRGPRTAPVMTYRTRPASAAVAVALPAPVSRPRVHPGYREWRPPQTIERKFLSLSRGCTPAGIPMGDTPTLSPPPKHIKVMRDAFLDEHARSPGKNTFTRKASEPVLGQDILGTMTGVAAGIPGPDNRPPIVVDVEKIGAKFAYDLNDSPMNGSPPALD